MPKNSLSVLHIDDERSSFLMLQSMLSTITSQIVKVEWISDFEEGVASMHENRHDVYVLDYALGERTGLELLIEIYGKDHGPIIFLTGHPDFEIDVEAMRLGAFDYIEKTQLNPIILERSIRYAIERKRVERELQLLYAQLRSLEQLKTDMIRIAAHDLKSPITTIFGFSSLLRDRLQMHLADIEIEYFNEIEIAAKKMQKITSDILSLERIEEMHKSQMTKVDLGVIATTIFQEQSPKAKHKKQIFILEAVSQRFYVDADRTQLEEAVDNLVGNAIKYTAERGEITIKLYSEADKVFFTIQDSGYGIPQDQQAGMFQPFFRVNSRETQAIDGTGLGLYLVKNIIVRHKGEMIFESEYGTGSLFGFWLPQTQ